jgi:hypothetical protein
LSYDYAALRGNIVPFTGSFTLSRSDAGKIFRCEDTANVTVTVPGDLLEGFNCGFIMYSTGTVTIAAGTGASNKSGKTALSTQYQSGSVLMSKRTADGQHDFLLGGDFA